MGRDQGHSSSKEIISSLSDPTVLSSLWYDDLWALPATGRVSLLALCKYVSMCPCTHVLDLPDVLLLEDQCLDMFDLESDHSADLPDETLVEVSSFLPDWVSFLVGGLESIVFGSIRWCVW